MPERASLTERLCDDMMPEAWNPRFDMGGKADSGNISPLRMAVIEAGDEVYIRRQLQSCGWLPRSYQGKHNRVS
jgi:hypothetical protein